jgi:hypothetical protein
MSTGVEFSMGAGSALISSRISVASITIIPSKHVYFLLHMCTECWQLLLPCSYAPSKNPCLRKPAVQSDLGKEIPSGISLVKPKMFGGGSMLAGNPLTLVVRSCGRYCYYALVA